MDLKETLKKIISRTKILQQFYLFIIFIVFRY